MPSPEISRACSAVGHLAFVDDEQAFTVPTLFARVGDVVYVHGSAAGTIPLVAT